MLDLRVRRWGKSISIPKTQSCWRGKSALLHFLAQGFGNHRCERSPPASPPTREVVPKGSAPVPTAPGVTPQRAPGHFPSCPQSISVEFAMSKWLPPSPATWTNISVPVASVLYAQQKTSVVHVLEKHSNIPFLQIWLCLWQVMYVVGEQFGIF